MPQYLPLGAFRQGLLPTTCRSCAWWQTAGRTTCQGPAAANRRHEWITDLEQDWGSVGLLVFEPGARDGRENRADPVITASIHFAPGTALTRFRELPFPPLPPFSALLFCFHSDDESSRSLAKRLIRRALNELRERGVQEVFAVAHLPGELLGEADCRFFSADVLAESGFEQVARNGHLCLMRTDNRGLISLVDQVETAVRRMFRNEPAPSPAAWARGPDGTE